MEIPHPKVFCFGNEEKGEYFDVVKFFDDKWQFSYIENGSNKLAHSIEESFINYCSDNDFNYTIYIGQKCKVLRNEKCFIGTLYEVDSNKNTFSIKQNNGEIIEINCADVEEIFSEEEIGTIN